MFLTRFEQLMKERNMNKADICKAVQITFGALGGWYTKSTMPTADVLCKLADFFEVSTDYLLGRSNDVGMITVNNELSLDEQELIFHYRKLNFQNKNQTIGFVKGLAY